MTMEATIRARLEEALSPTRLDVLNESGKHAGHAGDDGSGESHWHVVIVSQAFTGQSRIAQHRAVHTALGDVMSKIHALSLDLSDGS
ncbi:BolA family transcriptional regulator [Jannaschia pagri]|uniref:BolA family transcriptional regulator n=1 Tax=Jannaschia pagri TaxID=2829797 RepID=A0ABQ4NJ10_9RHOB|nr:MULTISPECIES: BolA family protein [unclassified Jannaschia]GIT90567.1 BolA family transcriptional regulator [Jannaschia sp. AI_61]GIT94399.1 BolA family transcriptional regulator [Jannaschia sp. AI_62]